MSWSVGGVALLIFLLSPISQVADSHYTMFVSERLYRTGMAVQEVFGTPLPPVRATDPPPGLDGRWPYRFPPGSAILSIPFVAAMNALGVSAIAADGGYDIDNETTIQRRLAAILMALFTVVVYRLASARLPAGWAAAVALVTALGTQVWSTASRGLWSHTWGILLLGVALMLVVRAAPARRPALSAAALGTLLAWMFFVRPTFALGAAGIVVYVLVRRRERVFLTGAVAALWLLGFLGSIGRFGSMVPRYFSPGRLAFGTATHWTALAGNLVSPSRGLVVFVPAVLVVAYLLLRYRRSLSDPALVATALACTTSHWIVVSAFSHWWGGYSFGPRLMTDVLPWIVLLAVLGLEARRRALASAAVSPPRWSARARWAAAAAACALGIVIHGAAATRPEGVLWSSTPVDIDRHPERLWDWTDPQFLAFLRGRVTRALPPPAALEEPVRR